MRRETSLFLTLGLLSTIAPPIFAQDLQGQPDPVPPSSIIVGPQLIAWSELQKPQPVELPQRKPAEQRNQPDQKPTEPPAQSAQPQAHSVSGNQKQNK
ncbi:MAG: hypothetical protein WA261_12265, partial [Candidatus Sulfotelmatobacter sp.]